MQKHCHGSSRVRANCMLIWQKEQDPNYFWHLKVYSFCTILRIIWSKCLSMLDLLPRLKGQKKQDVYSFAQWNLPLTTSTIVKIQDGTTTMCKLWVKLGMFYQDFLFTKYDGQGQSFTMDTVVLDILVAFAILMMNLLYWNYYRRFQGHGRWWQPRYTVWSLYNGFEIFPWTSDSNNDVVLYLGAFYFNSQQDGTDILFFHYSTSSTSFHKSACEKGILNMDV